MESFSFKKHKESWARLSSDEERNRIIHHRETQYLWHLLHLASQVQGRVDRHLQSLQEQLKTVKQQSERVAQGQKARGRAAKSDVPAHLAQIEQMRRVSEGCAYLFNELHRLLQTVVLASHPEEGILDSASRQSELETVLFLLAELGQQAPAPLQREIGRVHKQVQLALPHLLLFPHRLEALQQQVTAQLGAEALSLMAWAWQRREVLSQDRQELLEGFHPTWRVLAADVLHAWDLAVRASSAVENWHSIVRPHLSVHRTLSAEMLALLAMRQNYRVAPRGLHAGLSPLQRSSFDQPETDWLQALGYPPRTA